MTLDEALHYIHSVCWKGSVPGLERISALLDKMGHPERRLKFIHVTGTNGKGSTCAMLASMFTKAGYKTGLYTSPYLIRFNERIQIDGVQIPDEEICEITEYIKPLADSIFEQPTEFEMVTALGFEYFARHNCDLVVCEVGMGGEFDATNVILPPEVAIICNIGLDHTAVLGNTVEQIAEEKAGIIKPGADCVLYQQSQSVTEIVRERCDEVGARLHVADFSELHSEFDSLFGQSFTYRGEVYALPLLGANQLRNAAVVLELVEVLRRRGWALDQSDVEHGLYAVSWPGRFELVNDEPCFIVDGGHNPQCAQTVAENLRSYFPDSHRVLLVGVLKDKDYAGIFDALDPVADEYVCIAPDSVRALPAEELGKFLEKYGKDVIVCESIKDGVSTALDIAGDDPDTMICAVGSLYSVGEIRACFEKY